MRALEERNRPLDCDIEGLQGALNTLYELIEAHAPGVVHRSASRQSGGSIAIRPWIACFLASSDRCPGARRTDSRYAAGVTPFGSKPGIQLLGFVPHVQELVVTGGGNTSPRFVDGAIQRGTHLGLAFVEQS